jgi:hypothetical protein
VGQDGDHEQATSSAGRRGAAGSCRVRFAGEHQSHVDRAHPGADSDLSAMNTDGSAVTLLIHADSEEQEPAFTSRQGGCP